MVALLAGLLLCGSAHAQPQPEFEPGDVIVHWKDQANQTNQTRAASRDRIAGRQVMDHRALTSRTSLYRLASRTSAATRAALEALRNDPAVARVEPNFIRRPFRVPNDTHYLLQWNIRAARLEQAWDRTTGNPQAVVAVVDTGILPGHPDLAGRLLKGFDFIADPNAAGDNNGWDDDPTDAGTDSLQSSAFHGTHVAGIIGAASNNQKGIVGVDWACKILAVRALGIQEGKGRDSDIAAAIRWAAGVPVNGAPGNPTPARVINLSFGGPGASYLLSDAIKDAQNRGTIVVAAAGNQGTDGSNIFPAAIPDVITVGATQPDGKRAPYSNYGQIVDLMAPGGNMTQKLPVTYEGKEWYAGILGTLYATSTNKYTYHLFEGTSQASPLIAGVVSLMLQVNPALNSKEALAILRKTANGASQCSEGCGTGLVDAAAALTATAGPAPSTGAGEKFPFSYTCATNDQCVEGVCSSVAGGPMICTRPCGADTACPTGATCVGGLCNPSSITPSYAPGAPSAGQSGPGGTIWGGGCSVAGAASPPPTVLLLLLFLVLRRSRRRP
jgi:serine protease